MLRFVLTLVLPPLLALVLVPSFPNPAASAIGTAASATELTATAARADLGPLFLPSLEHAPQHSVPLDATALDSVIVETMELYHIPGMAACIVKDGQIVWHESYGYADVEQNIEVTDATVFMLASISKTFVATAIMQLWEEGLIGLDDDINDYLPFDVSNPWHPYSTISIRMILAHTSSIAYNADVWLPLITWGSDSPIPLGEFLADYLDPGGDMYSQYNYKYNAPGTGGEYSNIAYALAGYLVEVISGQTCEQYCQEHIFAPLGMGETSWFLAGLEEDNIAVPTEYNDSEYVPYGHFGFPVYPAGQLRTSSLQLARHMQAFLQLGQIEGNRILERETVQMMRTVQYLNVPVFPGYRWGLGWYAINSPYGWLWGHTGGIFGVSTLMYCHPEENYGVIYLTNGDGSDGHGIIAVELIEYAINFDPSPVYLASFTVQRQSRDALLTWKITHTGDDPGFHVWRQQPGRDHDQERVRISGEPITGRLDYEYVDLAAPDGAAEYWLRQVEGGGDENDSEIWFGPAYLAATEVVGPSRLQLTRVFPNPFNPRTMIEYFLPEAAQVRLVVYDVRGRLLNTVAVGPATAGYHTVVWDGRTERGEKAASGIYFVRLETETDIATRKVVLAE